MQSLTVSDDNKAGESSRPHSEEQQEAASYDKHTIVEEETDENDEETVAIEPSDAGSYASTVVKEQAPKPYLTANDTTNTLRPVKTKVEDVRK